MKSIESLSYSAMYTDNNSKKFTFKPMTEQIKLNGNQGLDRVKMPDYPGQQSTANTIREKTYLKLAQASVLARKNELGLILDILSSCLDVDPKQRPTIQGLLNSPIFQLDKYELTNAVRFSENVILYRAPDSTVSLRITQPLRMIC
jgi:serine/threonine protein kinase